MTDKLKKNSQIKRWVYGINLSSTINYSKCAICYCDYGAQIKGIIVHAVRLFTRNKLLLEKYQHIYVLSFIYVIYIYKALTKVTVTSNNSMHIPH